MNAYQGECLRQSSPSISEVVSLFPLSGNQTLNNIPVPNMPINIADVVVLVHACKLTWFDTAKLIKRIDSSVVDIELSVTRKRVQTIWWKWNNECLGNSLGLVPCAIYFPSVWHQFFRKSRLLLFVGVRASLESKLELMFDQLLCYLLSLFYFCNIFRCLSNFKMM